MHIPRIWEKASGEGKLPDGRTLPVIAWGWGDDLLQARDRAADRLRGMLERIRRGEPFPGRYAYGSRPLREEILRTVQGRQAGEAAAIVTRNGYGAQVLNAASLLFLDIDFAPPSFAQRLGRLLGGPSTEGAALLRLRTALQGYGKATFRIYRTASGLRAMAIDRHYDPCGREAQELMKATGTDPAFTRLCQAQRSFRARLTPKPWRCHSAPPPGGHPRQEHESQQRFASWLREYEKASSRYATCRYLETIGSGHLTADAKTLQQLHDEATRSNEPLPLA
jgi:hypothetical protein